VHVDGVEEGGRDLEGLERCDLAGCGCVEGG
jgi:hypothetical protein